MSETGEWTVRPTGYLQQTKLGCACLMCQRRRNLDSAHRAMVAPNLQCQPEIPVTDEMRDFARTRSGFAAAVNDDVLNHVFRVMRAKEPARDGDFQAMLKGYREQYALAVERAEIIAAKDARIAELDTELAILRRMKCDESPPPPKYPVVADPIPAIIADKPKPPKKHDPFNLPMKDHRRMGPE